MNDDHLMTFKVLKRSLKDEPEREVNDDTSTPSPKGSRIGSSSNKLLLILMGILIIVIFAGGLFYFITRRSTEGDATTQSKMTDFEEKIANLERQIAELQGKLGTMGQVPGLLQRLEALTQKVEALEKRAQPTTESKLKLAPSNPVVTVHKRHRLVQKGETLYGISKKYGITVEELRKLNNLSEGQSVQIGQKLLISLGQ